MMRALFAGVSGLRNHQTRMDVIGNNIANVNTVGFKASRVTFKEAFSQVLEGASRPAGNLGGINPMQVGTGMNIGSIDQLYTQGSLESTGETLDLAIQGNAMFVLSNGSRNVFSRAGNFQLDANGMLIAPSSGFVVQGVNADQNGNFTSTNAIGDVQIRLSDKAPARATDLITLTGNLDASAEVGDVHNMGITVYDSTGTPHELRVTFTNTGAGQWTWEATCATAPVTPAGTGTVSFGVNGSLASFTYPGGGSSLTLTPTAGAPFTVEVSPGSINGFGGLVGFTNPSNAVVSAQNGYQAGDLVDISVDNKGVVTGYFSNGVSRNLAQVALATFNNPGGLLRSGDSVYEESPNSGSPVIGFVGETSSSTLTPGALESSNVDISQEFTNMIIAQRGFQANARVITTADQMLQELVNLKQ